MDRLTDQHYLRDEQYRTQANLRARISLHQNYSINPYPWQEWVFDQLDLRPGMKVLEIGCGPGDLWRQNTGRLEELTKAAPIELFLADLSTGMVAAARSAVTYPAGVLCADAQFLPFPSDYFDLVIANHMLYHVPDITKALADLERILAPRGMLLAATNGEKHLVEIHNLIAQYSPDLPSHADVLRHFSLESAPASLEQYFKHVEGRFYYDHLEVTSVEPLIAYIRSMWDAPRDINHVTYPALHRQIAAEINVHGFCHITKSQGVFIAHNGD